MKPVSMQERGAHWKPSKKVSERRQGSSPAPNVKPGEKVKQYSKVLGLKASCSRKKPTCGAGKTAKCVFVSAKGKDKTKQWRCLSSKQNKDSSKHLVRNAVDKVKGKLKKEAKGFGLAKFAKKVAKKVDKAITKVAGKAAKVARKVGKWKSNRDEKTAARQKDSPKRTAPRKAKKVKVQRVRRPVAPLKVRSKRRTRSRYYR